TDLHYITYFATLQPPRTSIIPYTTLFRSPRSSSSSARSRRSDRHRIRRVAPFSGGAAGDAPQGAQEEREAGPAAGGRRQRVTTQDRKSTRLNSSHVKISYAVFCLKKKKKN